MVRIFAQAVFKLVKYVNILSSQYSYLSTPKQCTAAKD